MFSLRTIGRLSLLLSGIAVLLIAGLLLADLFVSREQTLETATRQISRHDHLFAGHVARSLDSVEVLLDEMAVAINDGGGWLQWPTSEGHRQLRSRLSRALPQVRQLLIFDADGRQRHTSFSAIAPAVDVSDRAYFQHLRDGADRSRYGPLIGRNSQRLTYVLARRLGILDFNGVLLASIEPGYFDEYCQSSRPYPEFEAGLINAEGKLIAACQSLTPERPSTAMTNGDDFRAVMAGGAFSALTIGTTRSVSENSDYVISIEPVPAYPDLRVVSVTPRGQIMREWNAQARRTLLLATLALATLIAAGWLVRGQLSRLAALTRELRENRETLEQRIAEATREVENRRSETVRLADAKARFFAAASHDLRQPLHALQLFLGDLSRLVHDDEQRVLVGRIDQAARSMARQLRSLLDLSRLDMANIVPDYKQIAVPDLFTQLAATYASSAESAGVRIVFRPRDAVIETDPALLIRLLGNLIDNAVKFAPHGSILVCARWRPNAVRIDVRDNGRGIASEHQARVFDEFFQIENRARDPDAGLGLGLAIANRIAHLLGTSIGLRSAPGRGSAFSLLLPSVTIPQALSDSVERSEQPARLILIDLSGADNELSSFAERASRWGYSVVPATSIAAAWRLIESERDIVVVLHTGICTLSGDLQALLRRRKVVVITSADCDMPELGAYQLREPVRPARLRALLRSLHG